MKNYILKYKTNLILSVIFGVLEVYFIYLYSLKSAEFINIVTGNEKQNILKTCLITIIYIAIAYFSFYISKLNCENFANNISIKLRHDYFEGLYKNKVSSFYSNEKETYITDIDQNIDQLRLDYLKNLPNALKGIGQVIVYLIALYKIHLYILILTIVFVIFPALISKVFSNKISNLRLLRSKNHSSYLNKLNELLEGFLLIKESKSKNFFIKRFDKSDKKLLDASKNLNLSSAMLYQSMFALNLLSSMLIILLASILVSLKQISLVELIASISLVSISTNAIAEAFKYLSTVFSTIKLKDLVMEKLPNKTSLDKDDLMPKLDLEIKDLSFSYEDNNTIFSDLSIKFSKNKSYAIIGKSGSGKSSLAKILMKINENYKGLIKFDNGDFKDFNEAEIYSLIYYIPQNPVVFNMSLLENIVMTDDDYNKEKVIEIIKKVDLYYLLLSKKDNRIDGNSLSGGEKKKLALARALYKNAKLIIFDEPQSGLDPKSSEIIESLIFSLDKITRIVITHNQDRDYLSKFDELINIEDYK